MNNKKQGVKRKKSKKETPDLEKKSRLSAMKRLVRPRKKIEKEEKTEIREKPEDPFIVLRFVLMTEKAIQLIEKENKLVFIVDRKYSKSDIEGAAESAFQTAIKDVKTSRDQEGRKKAFIRFKQAGIAGEIAMRLGII